MIARKHRFHGHRSVSRVRGKPIHTAFFSLYSVKNKRHGYRMAVVVSKKVAKSAVTRNRIRRRFYECVRSNHLVDDTPIDLVFVVKQEQLATIDFSELQDVITSAVAQATDTLSL